MSTRAWTALRVLAALSLAVAPTGCNCEETPTPPSAASADTETVAAPHNREPTFTAPRLLFLPDAGDQAPPEAPFSEFAPVAPSRGPCPADMVFIRYGFCIDRYETTLEDVQSARRVSPYYHPERSQVRATYERWSKRSARSNTQLGRQLEVPKPPDWQLSEAFDVRAMSRPSAIPNGYLNLNSAVRACENAGKRLCSHQEWVTACRGDRDTKFPYGDEYVAGRCNVFREAHPAALLHGNASIHHLDPRLNLAGTDNRPLLRKTGESAACASRWGSDAVYDMVGNLDEWIEDPSGRFVGGFFSRATKEGCDAAISSHPPEYFDYSLGTRCCRQP